MYTRDLNCFSYCCNQLSQLEEIVDSYHCSISEGCNKFRGNCSFVFTSTAYDNSLHNPIEKFNDLLIVDR
ncbi:hypothetical protein V1478_004437 [Vespula squamosa]|uniref:Uncharacterized protein n=1 Tax=Vespula squamosa TaxID=30214 RepID=A0ABD2BG73_VESSQ